MTRKSSRAAGTRRASARPAAEDGRIALAPPSRVACGPFLVQGGAPPAVGTVVFVHGIGNKPAASVLKCQWDSALFGAPLGERSRMAYWVNRERYPVPEAGTCAGGDRIDGASVAGGLAPLATDAPFDPLGEAARLTPDRRRRARLASIAREVIEGAGAASDRARRGRPAGGVEAKLLPLPEAARRRIAERLTRLLLPDVHDFLFDAARRETMRESLLERLRPGGGPFVVVAHSLGSVVAFDVLRRLDPGECDVRLFLTLGSPLGLTEVKDELARWMPGGLAVPACVARWVNLAQWGDPVAIDAALAGDIARGAHGVAVEDVQGDEVNADAPWSPHSATGYLRGGPARTTARETVGTAFAQPVGQAVLMRDLVEAMEDAHARVRHPTLIQLAAGEPDGDPASRDPLPPPLDEARGRARRTLEALVAASGEPAGRARIQVMRRWLSADLTRDEIERLRTLHRELAIEKVWRNAVKRALLDESAITVQVRPANLAYGARGDGIGWAVLDTGIRADHPHFRAHGNVVAQWDCTRAQPPTRIAPGEPGFDTLDGNGHGTHVAGILAGELAIAREPGAAPMTLAGMAPAARLYGFKVLRDDGTGEDASIIKALDAIAELNERAGELVIHGVNLSLGGAFDPSVYGCGHTPLCQELRRLWNQGVLVVLAAGNEGYALLRSGQGEIAANMDLSIGDPANLDEAIAVGSVHKSRPHTYGVSYFSSRGPTADGRFKPDVVAPGERILSAFHLWDEGAGATAAASARELYVEMSGTSMAAPHVSGMLAAFLSVRREFVGYPARVKALLLGACTDLGRDRYVQGSGLPNLMRMLLSV